MSDVDLLLEGWLSLCYRTEASLAGNKNANYSRIHSKYSLVWMI